MSLNDVTLIVKAPNQQIEDQIIFCQSSWSVKKLKGYLSEVYPIKPSIEDQKIIYSGQLLEDNSLLKDVLRKYDCQVAYTVHLVCAAKKMAEPVKTGDVGQDGLRRRNVEVPASGNAVPGETGRPETQQNNQNHSAEMASYMRALADNYGRAPPYPEHIPMGVDPSIVANRLMVMHHAYLQYLQQYVNMWQTTANGQTEGAAPSDPTPNQPQPQPEVPAEPRPEDPEEPGAPRDWLDHVYAASRLAILFSLVYLYGSPARFLLVLLLVVLGYLHQIGFFRDMQFHGANNNNNQRNPPNEQPANPPAQPEQPVQPNQANPAEPVEPPRPNPNQVEEQNHSFLAVTWMIFSSFFASLIPDVN